jgi:hypothetical protein
MKNNVKLVFENVETGKKEVTTLHNTECTAGKNSLALRMVGAEKGQVTYFAVGTGDTSGGNAPDASDTALNDELTRKQISVRSATGNTANFRVFFNTSEANGTLTEIGLFGDDASVTADSGTLFARASISKTKTSAETLTIDWSLDVD